MTELFVFLISFAFIVASALILNSEFLFEIEFNTPFILEIFKFEFSLAILPLISRFNSFDKILALSFVISFAIIIWLDLSVFERWVLPLISALFALSLPIIVLFLLVRFVAFRLSLVPTSIFEFVFFDFSSIKLNYYWNQ